MRRIAIPACLRAPLLGTGVVLACLACDQSSNRAHLYFGVAKNVEVRPETICEAVLRDLPLGTSEARVRQVLASRKIGIDPDTAIVDPAAARIIAEVRSPRKGFAITHRDFVVFFNFDSHHLLQRVEVKQWQTGL